MARNDESLAVSLAKHPLVWSGTGLLVRYFDDPSQKAQFWTTIGLISLGIGVTHTIATQAVASPVPGARKTA